MIEEKILDMLEEICGDGIVKEDRDIDLLEEGLIDSLDYVTLLVQIDKELGIALSPTEFTKEEMATPNRIIKSVSSRI